ncbi:hypothetical protein IWZ03DRAFT_418965 [Phyllosticta citriasiana]|uniref:Uncharacterized protein n=1 Tax=Phyllosticta citriasiana TaxID=595635 RepID=A0ABR1KAU4_9PEZI
MTDKLAKRPEEWSNFSEGCHEYARWRWSTSAWSQGRVALRIGGVNNFTITEFSRVEGKRLRELFNPQIRKMGQLKARKDAKKLFKKPFFAAQLKYHDIKFKSSSKVDDLRNLLEESVRQGKCDHLHFCISNATPSKLHCVSFCPSPRPHHHSQLACNPRHVISSIWPTEPPTFKRNGFELRDQIFTVSGYDRFDSQRLRESLHPRPTAYNPLGKKVIFAAQLKHYGIKFRPSSLAGEIRSLLEESIQQGKKKSNTPQEEAEYDFEWFPGHHFLTDRGEPDRTKTPEVLGLQGFYDKRELIARVVAGLHRAPCRHHIEFGENHDLCVGWDEAAVVRKAQDINRVVEEERK